ncbi:AMP-binding protein, partial [Mycobacterium sp. IS-3022]|uniref:AMP-binding protein n=1 Tax=Mycobacterium sp. IS-3022 TaxID=1772277 RepID=UPI0012E3F94D
MGLDHQGLPLTRRQLDIWLAQASGHSGTEWQLGMFVKIDGAIQPDLFEQAIRKGLQEAEPIRAAFFERDGQVFQRAIDYSDVELARYDLIGSDDPAQKAREIATSIERTPMPFDGKLMKFALFRTLPDEYYWFACCHHIVIDGMSMGLVGRRIAAIYSALVDDTAASPAFFGSLRDLVTSELDYEASTEYLDDTAYWRETLPPQTALEYRTPQTASGPGDHWPSPPVHLDPAVAGRVKELAKALGVRRSSVLTAACALLVRGCSTVDSEVVLDFPVSRRVTAESKTLPGMIAGVVPLVLKTSPHTPVADFCRQVDTQIREALRHQRFPVQSLENDLHGSRQAPNRVVLNFVPSRLSLNLGGVPATATYTTFGPVGHFGFFFIGAGDQQSFCSAGAGQPFAGFAPSDLAARLEQMLTTMAAHPGRRLPSIDVLGAGEPRRLDEWGHRAVLTRPGSTPSSIPAVFAAQVTRMPEAVALVCGGRSWTYRELDEASNRLAHLLSDRGVTSGQIVTLLFSRCAEAIVSILAVLKTGAAYLPIDPASPAARIEYLIQDAAPVAAVTTAGLRSRLAGCGLPVVDVADPRIDTQPDTPLPVPAPDDVAHIIYTSGTTGAPKGVAITHHNLTQLLAPPDEHLPPRAWAQWHSYGFDASAEEIWRALLHGGRLVIVPEEVAASPHDLNALLVAEHVSVLSQTPSALGTLPPEGLDSMALLVAGEACPAELVDRWAGGRVMINGYGPTETTICASRSAPLEAGCGAPPIGSPAGESALFVLDGWLRPVPAGVVGELYLAGRGVG